MKFKKKAPKKRLERNIEAGFMRKMKNNLPEVRILKLNTLGRRAWPDRMILMPAGRVIFIEFKRVGEEVTPLQKDVHEYLGKRGYDVQVFDNEEEAFQYVWKFR